MTFYLIAGAKIFSAMLNISGKRIHSPMQKMWIQSLGQEDSLEKEMATHSCILAWEIPWTEERGGLQSMGSQESDRFSD